MVKPKVATGITVALSLLVGGSAYALRSKQAAPDLTPVRFDALPMQFDLYQGTEERFAEGTYKALRADTTMLRRYWNAQGATAWVFVAYFGEQNYGEQIHSPRNCLPGEGWNILTLDRVAVPIPGRGEVVTNRLLIESGGRQQIMYYFFVTRLGTVASEYRLKFDLARAALTFQPRDAFFVRVSAMVGESGSEAADETCRRLLAAGMPLLSRGLPF